MDLLDKNNNFTTKDIFLWKKSEGRIMNNKNLHTTGSNVLFMFNNT